MPSTHAAPEPQSEQRRALPLAQHASQPDTGIRQNRPRSLSSKSDRPGGIFGSGSPQIHRFLTSSSPVTKDSHTAGIIPAPQPDLHRHSFADFDHPGDAVLGGACGGVVDRPGSTPHHEIRDHKRAKLAPASAPAPAQRRPDPSAFETIRPSTSRESSSTIREALQDKQLTKNEFTTDDLTNSPTYADAFTFRSRVVSGTDIHQSLGDEAAWASAVMTERKLSLTARSTSSSSSAWSSPQSDATSEKTADTDISFHEHEIGGDETPVAPVPAPVEGGRSFRVSTNKRRSRGSISDPNRYGTPEMPRGTAKLPHIPASYLTPRMPNQGYAKYLPRAEKLPMSGYELLASSISSTGASASIRSNMSAFLGSSSASNRHASRRNSSASLTSAPSGITEGEVTIKPIYRKFEVLNHRLLLQLQDELSELEEQLHRLDTADTQTRRLRSSIMPASRRAEFLAGGELQWHKTDILSKIGFKLGQYSMLLPAYLEWNTQLTLSLRPPTLLFYINTRPSCPIILRRYRVPHLPRNAPAHF